MSSHKSDPPRVVFMGLPGSGKTTLAKIVAKRLKAVHFNADEVRATVSRDLGFSNRDRVVQAERLGAMAQMVSNSGYTCLCDFVCPTRETRNAFKRQGTSPFYLVWIDTIKAGRFNDTNAIFETPVKEEADVFYHVTEWATDLDLELEKQVQTLVQLLTY